MKMNEAFKFVQEMLLRRGWERAGETVPHTYRGITTESYPLAGYEVTVGGKPRFRKGDWFCAVGKRFTKFYAPKGKDFMEWDWKECKTRDTDKVMELEAEVSMEVERDGS